MLYSYGTTLLILCPLTFLAAFIDAIAGGGGLISVPAYLFVGIPAHNASGTNKFAASMGTAVAVLNYIRGGCVDYAAALPGSAGAILSSWLGTQLALSLSPRILQIALMAVLPLVGIFIISGRGAKDRGAKGSGSLPPRSKRFKVIAAPLAGFILGCYDGFFGPGTGMFLTLTFSGLIRLDLIKSVGTAKFINFFSNLTSMLTWLAGGKVLFPLVFYCMICSISGGFLGSRMAMKIGKKFVRLMLVFVAVLLFVKILFDLRSMR